MVKKGTLSFCELHFANHPIPDEAGVTASQSMMDIAQNTQPKDIVFCCITGGSTSLMPLHVDTISLDDLKQTYKLLLRSGANIIEMNAVRKHLSRIKGGWLAKNIHPEAELINLTVSDVIGDPLDYITCPTVPDTSTFDDARATLTKYNLWEKLPKSVCTYLKKAGQDQETPKKLSDHKIHNFIIVKGDEACVAAMTKAQELGYNSMILTTMLEGESKEAGSTFAAIAKEIVENNRPLKKPCVVISGGETTIRITGKAGEGGPNQQFALSAATWIEGLNNVVIASIDTDGTDGVSTLAGGIVDGKTMEKARLKGIDLQKHINEFDDTPALQALGDGIFTGATGTNVNDLQLMLVR